MAQFWIKIRDLIDYFQNWPISAQFRSIRHNTFKISNGTTSMNSTISMDSFAVSAIILTDQRFFGHGSILRLVLWGIVVLRYRHEIFRYKNPMIYLNSPFRPAKLLLNSFVQIFFTVSLSVPCHNALSNTTESVWSSLRIFFFWASYCVCSCPFWIRLIYTDIDLLHECRHDVLICIKRPNISR